MVNGGHNNDKLIEEFVGLKNHFNLEHQIWEELKNTKC